MKLFVYGTLKRGFCNHSLLEDATFISETDTSEKYTMLDLDMFPGVVKEEKSSHIQGELYNINPEKIEIIDAFEGNWYSRQIVDLKCGTGAWMYFLDMKLADLSDKYDVIEDGKWKEKSC